jgi:hypothetical protein
LGIVQGADLPPDYTGGTPNPLNYPNKVYLPGVRK